MARKLNCIGGTHDAVQPGIAPAAPSASLQTPLHDTSTTSTRSAARRSASRGGSLRISEASSRSVGTPRSASTRGKEKAVEDTPDESSSSSDSEEEDPSFQVEIPSSQLQDAPPLTQTQGESSQVAHEVEPARKKPRRRTRDRTDVGSANILATNPGRHRRARDPFTPNP